MSVRVEILFNLRYVFKAEAEVMKCVILGKLFWPNPFHPLKSFIKNEVHPSNSIANQKTFLLQLHSKEITETFYLLFPFFLLLPVKVLCSKNKTYQTFSEVVDDSPKHFYLSLFFNA